MKARSRELPDFESAWAAIQARDQASDGHFVFAVSTTGIYCLPSCPSRRPLRCNVRFFPDPGAAEAAGFRACLRCRPRLGRPDRARQLVDATREYLECHLDETVTLERLAQVVGVSRWHLQRTFKKITGLSPRGYVNARRLERLRDSLKTADSVTDAVYEAGFTSASQLYAQSDRTLGMTPGEWRDGGKAVRVRFATASSALGRVLVAATDRGLCAVLLGENDGELERVLRRELPQASIEEDQAELRSWLGEVLRRTAGQQPSAPIPTDTPATDFQRRVWAALTEIPHGETRSYRDIAELIGRPQSARAVARACSSNRLAVVVPCHRVVTASGESGGYRWGSDKKQQLLAEERVHSSRREG